VERYFDQVLIEADPGLEATLAFSAAAGLPPHHVSPSQGKMLHLLARAIGARQILEIGTLGGYSTIWLARALPEGARLVTLEADAKHAATAQANLSRAGLSGVVQVRIGRAIDSLPRLAQENAGPFDLIFIDADKAGTADYFAWALRLSRPGSLIIVDNVVREGTVIDAASGDASVRGIRRFMTMVASERRISATVLQTVGAKGWDGWFVGVVR
jgi:predicted O-methyltransferase YrrM